METKVTKVLIFDSETFNRSSLIQKISYITGDPLTELYHAKDIDSFTQMVIYNAGYKVVIINFQMIGFWDLNGEQLERFVLNVRKLQRDLTIFIGVTSWENQVSTLRRLGLSITHKDYNGIQVDVEDVVWKAPKVLTKEDITNVVCSYYEIPYEKVFLKSRKRELVKARQVAMHLFKLFTTDSLKAIGEFFGGRDHTTVIHSCQTVKDLMDSDNVFKGEVVILQETVERLRTHETVAL